METLISASGIIRLGLFLLISLAPTQILSAELELDFGAQDPINLEGPWEFYWQRFVEPGAVSPPKPTTFTRLPGSWTNLELEGSALPPAGHATYRLVADLGPDHPPILILRVPMVYSAYRLYANGELVAEVGKASADPQQARPDYGERRVQLEIDDSRLELVFHVSNYTARVAGIPKPIEIGSPNATTAAWAAELMATSALAGGLLLIGISQITLYMLRRRELAYLFFGLTVAFWAMQTVFSAQLLEQAGWHIPVWLARPLDGFSALATGVFYLWFISALFPRELPFRYVRWAALPVVIYLVVAIVDPGLTRSQVIGWLLYLMVGLLSLALIAIVRAWRNNQPDAVLILLGSGIAAFTAVLQIYWFNESGVRDAIASIGVLAAMGLYSIALAKRYARAFERSRRLETALRRANRLKDEFLANTSHELRTPLHAMIGLAESLPRDQPRLQRGLDLIVQSGRRLARLVDDTISLTQLQHGELPIHLRPTALSPLFHSVMDTCSPLTGSRPVRLKTDISEDFPPVRADPDRLYQVLFNLVGNAIKFTDRGHIRVAARQNRDHAIITIDDTGIGMTQEELTRAQQPYEQAHQSSLDGRGGFGLGLTISHALLERQGAKLSIESTPGKGTTVSFQLPVMPGGNKEDIPLSYPASSTPLPTNVPETLVGPTQQPTSQPQATGDDRPLILVVDDEPTAAMVVEEQLAQHGYRTMTAHSGQEALKLVHERQPQLVLLDVMMPDMSGLAVCRRLREEFDSNSLPILLVTARTRPEDVVEGLEAGANDHIAKPFWRREMLARVEAQLRVHENEQMRWALRESKVDEGTDSSDRDPRELLVALLEQSVIFWEGQTGQTRADLAEQSQLWTVTIDGSSRKTRTLDRYMSIETLPKRPRWGVVTRTARFVAKHLEDYEQRGKLVGMIREFEELMDQGRGG